MKFETLRKTLLLGAATIFVWWAWKAPAQDTINASARVPYAVSQVIQLEQAKIGDDTVIAYIRNSGNSYNLTANDILYLRGQGVSDVVLTAMLTQPKANVANIAVPSSYSQPAAPAPQYSAPAPDASAYTAPTAPVQPQVTYVQSAPSTYYYPSSYYPYSYSYPYYGYYGYYPSYGWGWWGGGWHWGWGYHGGWNTGWHGGWGGGGWHGSVGGGFHGGVGGGGFHGGGGGGFHGGGGHR